MAGQRVLGGRYLLQEVLGRGGMATVWRGRDLRLQRAVAVKVLDLGVIVEASVWERLAREARTLARLAHPNIVGVHDFDVQDDTAYLVMELVQGPSLAVLLAQGKLPVGQAVRIAVGICDALAAAHDAGILHRDVKPGNLLIVADGGVKVCDFGLARPPVTAAMPDAATVDGTCEYLAPERVNGQPGDARGDLYALGCVVYAMLAGAPPFTGSDPAGVLRRHVHELPRPLGEVREDIPAGLDGLVVELLAKNPADRPDSAHTVRDRLTAVAGHPGTAAHAETATFTAGVAAPAALAAAALHSAPTQMMTRPGRRHRRRSRWRTQEGPGVRLAVVACAVLVLLGGAFAVLPAVGGSPGAGGSAGGGSPSDRSLSGGTSIGVSAPDSTQPSPTGTSPDARAPTPSTSPGRPASPADQIVILQAMVTQQADTGQLDPRAAQDLLNTLNDIARRLTKGQTGQAAGRVTQLRDRLTGLAQDGKLTSRGYQILVTGIDRLAGSLVA